MILSVKNRFNSKVELPDAAGCMSWRGTMLRNGYGQFSIAGRKWLAHRFSYRLNHGEIPPGSVVRHTCDNPRCVAPLHLIAGTQADNLRDRTDRGRSTNQYTNATHCIRGHKFSGSNLAYTPSGTRRCKACAKLRWSRR